MRPTQKPIENHAPNKAIKDLFVFLFKRYYPSYTPYEHIDSATIARARAQRFQKDPYWSIWKEYGHFVGFVEGFFHRQSGTNQLPILFAAHPDEVRHFENARHFLARFHNKEDFLSLLVSANILRMRNQNASHIYTAAQRLVTEYGNQVPSSKQALSTFKGYGAKITNMVLNTVFDQEEIAVDIRVFRASIALGLIHFEPKDFRKDSCKKACEERLRELVPKEFLIEADYLLFKYGGEKSSVYPKLSL